MNSSYETHLTTLSLQDLRAEPGTLQTQAHHLTSSLTSLTHTSYPTFLSLHQSTTALSKSLNSLSESLSDLTSTSLPTLQNATAAWNEKTTDILRERSKARLVLDQHDKIKDLLDIPIFIDSCVRNGYFQEALALYNHISALATRPGSPPILASIHAEVEAAIAHMLVVLLGTLYEPGKKLPSLWKAVNFLRKMDAFGSDKDHINARPLSHVTTDEQNDVPTDDLLALAFLTGRLTCLTTALEPISRDVRRLTNVPSSSSSVGHDTSPKHDIIHNLSNRDQEDIARYLKKYIDVWREGAYDILSQYSTIFLEQQQNQHPTSPHLPLKSPIIQVQSLPTHTPASSLLPVLSPHLLSLIFPLLNSTLPLLPLPLLPSLLTQLTYCATAFARVGLDFRGLLDGLFNTAVSSAVRHGLDAIPSVFGTDKTRTPSNKKPSEWLVTASATTMDAQIRGSSAQGPPHIPPQMLTAYPPLAKLTNALLGVLNALRLLAPVRILRELVGVLDKMLKMTGDDLIGYLRAYVQAKDQTIDEDKEGKEEDRASRAVGEAYFHVLVPFMRRALVQGVYGVEIGQLGEVGDEAEALKKTVREWDDLFSA